MSNESPPQNGKKKGNGCLIAIVISVVAFFVIAVLGILAAVAIPGFMAYTKASKTSEAKINLRSIANGAAAYAMENKACPVAETPIRLGPIVDSSTMGQKHVPSEEDYNEVWKDLHFRLTSPSYYTYYYISDGKTFKARAFASLSDNCDSVFEVSGIMDSSGTLDLMPIVDKSENGIECNSIDILRFE